MLTHDLADQQRGSSLLEALVAIFVFSIGVLALIGMQAITIRNSTDAKNRADAAALANQIIGRMWVDRANITTYAHQTGGTTCNFTGATSSQTEVTNWLNQVTNSLPTSSLTNARIAQIKLTSMFSGTQQVTVTICWKQPQETIMHNFTATAHINL